MCGIVGLFIKDKALEPKLGHLLSGMLATMGDRGPDSAGFAVYGRPARRHRQDHRPVGHAGDGLRRISRPRSAEAIGARGRRSSARARTPCCGCRPTRPMRPRAALRRMPPGHADHGRGRRIEIYKEVGLPDRGRRALRPRRHGGHAWHRPHPHGDRIGGDDARRASVLDRRRPVPGPQRLAVQPQQPAPRACRAKA